VFRGDVGFVDPESDLAGRDKVDSRSWLAGNDQSIGGMGVGADVERLHPGEFAPLLLVVLVAADMFSRESEREPSFDLCNLVDHVVFRARGGACEGRSGGESRADAFDESLVVCGDAQPGFRIWQKDGSGELVQKASERALHHVAWPSLDGPLRLIGSQGKQAEPSCAVDPVAHQGADVAESGDSSLLQCERCWRLVLG
jgi:hypothetical protein